MNTQIKFLAAACAMVAAGSAMALPFATTIPAGQTIFLSGSSALAKDLHNEIVGTLCVAGTADLYTDTAAALGKDFAYYTCTSNVAGVTGPIAVAYRSNGGSFFGTAPVGSYAIGLYNVNNSTSGCPASNPVTTGPSPAVGSPKCSGWTAASASVNGTTAIPDIGLSDEEPALFSQSLNQPTSFASPFGEPTSAPGSLTAKNFSANAVLVQTMGVVASTPMISALMAAGAKDFTGAHANMQTSWLSTAFSAGSSVQSDILTNTNNNGQGDWAPLSDLVTSATGVTTSSFSGSVILCRRAPGSGTQASLQAKFLNIGCNSAVNTPADPSLNVTLDTNGASVNVSTPSTVPASGYYEVYNNTSSGAVITCMQQAASAGLLALGVLSVDQGVKTGYDFVAIDGAYPTDATVANGSYGDIVESNLNVANGLTGAKAKLTAALVAAAKTVNTQSPAGVYNVAGAINSLQGTSVPKTMKGSIAGLTCKPALF